MSSSWFQNRRAVVLLAAAVGVTSLGDDCDGDIVSDPTFRDWCGASLCSWTLDVGKIAPVPTWSADDLGVSFLDTPTQISQVTSESAATCILFTTVADIDPSAQMTLLVDFDNDGTIDFTAPLGATQWEKVQSEITAPAAYSGITFHIRKEGTGTAILAEMRIQSTTGCTGTAPALTKVPLGDPCQSDGECASGVCSTNTDGLDGICSECSMAHPCPDGWQSCMMGAFYFEQCSPGEHTGATGELCVTGSDCQSGACDGAEVVGDSGVDLDASTCVWFLPLDAGSSASTEAGPASADGGRDGGGDAGPRVGDAGREGGGDTGSRAVDAGRDGGADAVPGARDAGYWVNDCDPRAVVVKGGHCR
jgi:hypothetical protein